MENQLTIKSLIQEDDFLASIDLSDAFVTIPLHSSSKRFAVFEFENVRYCYNVLFTLWPYKFSPYFFQNVETSC